MRPTCRPGRRATSQASRVKDDTTVSENRTPPCNLPQNARSSLQFRTGGPGRWVSNGCREPTASISRSTRGTPPASPCWAILRRTRLTRSSSFASSIAHKTGSIWHCRIPAGELRGATLYGYRVEGPCDPEHGQRFDYRKSCWIPTRRRSSSRPFSAAKPAQSPDPLTGARRLAACPRSRHCRRPQKRVRDTPVGMRSFTNCMSKDSPRGPTPVSCRRSAAPSPA
jgi:hypothetical protein